MAKLKLDRSINMTIAKDETITVPTNEVWKVNFSHGPTAAPQVNGSNYTIENGLIGGGATIKGVGTTGIVGVAFKLIT